MQIEEINQRHWFLKDKKSLPIEVDTKSFDHSMMGNREPLWTLIERFANAIIKLELL